MYLPLGNTSDDSTYSRVPRTEFTDALAAHVSAVQADVHRAIREDNNEVDALGTCVQTAEDLLSQLQVACPQRR